MTLAAGDRIGRWQLLTQLPSRDGVERWRALATDTGEPAEMLTLARHTATIPSQTSQVATSDRAHGEFLELHEALATARDPALAHTIEVRLDEGKRYVFRTPLEVASLDAIKGPLDSPTVAWIGSVLLPAVLAAGPATRGALRAADIGIDASGRPSVAPFIEPLTRVALGSTRSVAPECFAPQKAGSIQPLDGTAGLYGLGVLLYTLLTGKEPQTAGTKTGRVPPPPPSALRHGVPAALDTAILRLLSDSPGDRAGALPLLQELSGPAVDLRTLLRSARPEEVRTGTALDLGLHRQNQGPFDLQSRDHAVASGPTLVPTATSRHAVERAWEIPGGMVVLPAPALAKLDPASRSLVAGLTKLPIGTLDTLIEAGLPVVLDTSAGRGAARDRAREIARTTGLPAEYGTNTTLPAWLWLAAATAISAIPALLGVVLLLTGLVPIALAAFVAAGVGMGAGALAMRAAGRPRTLHRDGVSAMQRTRASIQERDADGWLAPQWDRLSALRLSLARTDLPSAAASDLRGGLKEIEVRLLCLAEAGQTADRMLRQVDLMGLRAKLATLQRRADDPTIRAERDRLARTVSDLEVVEATRTRLSSDAAAVDALLIEIAAALGQLGSADEDEALARLQRVARHAHAADALAVSPIRAPALSDPVREGVSPTIVPAVEPARPPRAYEGEG